MKNLAKELNRLQKQGWTIGIITWLAKNGKPEYNNRVARAKLNWLEEHLNGFQFDRVHIVEYGTPKQELGQGILFDDEIQNRINWKDKAYDEKNIGNSWGNCLKPQEKTQKVLDKREKLWYNKIRKEGIRMKEFFRNDHLKVGKTKRIRALSPLWFAAIIGQALGLAVGLYIFVVTLWVLLG